jgi:phage terminase large subunit
MRIEATKIFTDINTAVEDKKRYIFLRGSSRSSKTTSAVQYIVVEALKTPNISITIARATQVSIKNTIMVDFLEILEQMDILHTGKLNKVDMTYTFPNGSVIRFVGLDDTTGRLRGLKSTYVLLDEINTIDRNSFIQLDIRTEGYIIGCYNPEVEEDWWGFDYEKKDNASLFISSWRDNPFLQPEIIQSIQELKDIDYDLWQIYSEGKLVPPREKIFIQPQTFSGVPTNIKSTYVGIDFGYGADPCAVIRVDVSSDNKIYATELLYEHGLTNQDLIFRLNELGVSKAIDIIGDSSEPKSIEEIRRAGFKIRGVKKGDGSVLFGIQKMRTFKIFLNELSSNLIKEFKGYKFKRDRSGRLTSTPEGAAGDHLIDALRYSVMEFVDKSKPIYSFR